MRDIALLPAPLSAFLFVAGAFFGAVGFAGGEASSMRWLGAIASLSSWLFLMVWLQGAFLIAEETRPPQSRRPPLNWLPFAFPVLVAAATLLANQPVLPQLCGVAGVLVFFALTYRAAAALVRAEGRVGGGVQAFNAVFVAWLGLFYFPIGVWFLRPRLGRLGDRPYRSEAVSEGAT